MSTEIEAPASYTTGGKEERCVLTLLLSQTPHFCQQGSVRARRGKSLNVCDVDGFAPIGIPNRAGVKEGNTNTVRREKAASLFHCGHECDHHSVVSDTVIRCLDAAVEVTVAFCLLSCGCLGVAALLGCHCWRVTVPPATGTSHSQVICFHSETDIIWRDEHMPWSLCR